MNFYSSLLLMVVLAFISALPGFYAFFKLRRLAQAHGWTVQEIREYSKKKGVNRICYISYLLPVAISLGYLLYFPPDLAKLTGLEFLALLASALLSMGGPCLLLLFIDYNITKEARKLTATKKDVIITLITPALIRVIFFFTFFALLYLPFLFQAFRESLFQGLKEPDFHTIFLLSYLLLSLIISFILDGYTTPLIYNHITKVEPIKDPQIREVVNRLLKKSDLRLREILLVKGAKWKNANAMVSGVFPSVRFLYLTDYLMDNFSIDEIETIVAHEFGHIKYRHLEKFVILSFGWIGTLIVVGIFFFNSIDPLQGIVVNAILCMVCVSLLYTYISRRFELQADTYAVVLTQKPESFISALRKLAQINEMPSTLSKGEEALQTHPSFERRIEKINKLKDDLQNGPCEKMG